MASQGPLFPGTVTTETGPSGDNDWTNPGNVGANDGSEAQITAATYDAGDHSFRLRASNFGFTIPAGATIDGIVVEIERRDFAGDAQDQEVRLFDSTGTLVGDDKQTATSWPASATIATYGGAADTWTAGLDVTDINSANFGVALIVLANSANTDIGVDFIRITVHYTPSPDVTVTPSPVAVPIAIPTPTLQRGIVRTPDPLAIALVIPTPTRVHAESEYEALIQSDGPVRYWRLGETSGTQAWEEMAGAHGTYQSAPALGAAGALAGDPDTAVTFDGGDLVTAPDHADLDFTNGPLSYEAWVKFDGTGGSFGDYIFGKGTTTFTFWLNTSDVLAFSVADVGDIMTGGTISDTDWHHVVAVYENGVAGEIYLDAVAVGGAVTDRTATSTSNDFAVGSKWAGGGATDGWHGSIDEAAVYNRILTAQEVQDHYDMGIGAGPVTVNPTPVAIPLVIPTPSVQVTKIVSPSPVAVPLVVPSPTIQVGARVLPDPVAVVLAFPAVTVDAGGGAPAVSVTPDPVVVAIAIPTPSIQPDRLITPSPVAVPLVIPAPTIRAGVTVMPSPVTVPLLIPVPAIAIGARVTPSPVTIPIVIPIPTVTAGGAIPPGFLDELLELAITGDLVTVKDLNGGSAGVVIVVTIAGVEVDAGGVLELDVEG